MGETGGIIAAIVCLGGLNPLCWGGCRKAPDEDALCPAPYADQARTYVHETRRGFGHEITWRPCRPIGSEQLRFQSGSYICTDEDSKFQSATYTRSCAIVLSLETGTIFNTADVPLGPYERDPHSTHRVNHRVVRTGGIVSSAQRHAMLQSMTIRR